LEVKIVVKRRFVLDFPRQYTEKPITYHLIKDYDIEVTILRAMITPDDEGRMMVEMKASEAKLNKAMDYLKGLDIKVTPLAHDIMFKEDSCTHCTYCVALCPVGAFEVEPPEMRVSFKKETCILCEQCARVCPYRAVEIMF
jgi:ferredoxin